MISRQQEQGSVPTRTVGDTLTVVHRVRVPTGALVQPRELADSLIATTVGVPRVDREGDSVRIAYTLAVWAPGQHELRIPGAIVIVPGGTADTLADATVRIAVNSLLPTTATVDTVTPRQARPWLPQNERSLLPFAVIVLPLLVLGAIWGWRWRRRGRLAPVPPPARESAEARQRRLHQWLDAGEVLLVVDHLAPLIPDSEGGRQWHDEVARLRFTSDAESSLRALALRGISLIGSSEVPSP